MAYRLPAEWMKPADDRLLEYLESEGAHQPKSLVDESPYDYHRKTVQRRLSILEKADLVKRRGRGVYRITSKGQAYLYGDEDLRGEPDPNGQSDTGTQNNP